MRWRRESGTTTLVMPTVSARSRQRAARPSAWACIDCRPVESELASGRLEVNADVAWKLDSAMGASTSTHRQKWVHERRCGDGNGKNRRSNRGGEHRNHLGSPRPLLDRRSAPPSASGGLPDTTVRRLGPGLIAVAEIRSESTRQARVRHSRPPGGNRREGPASSASPPRPARRQRAEALRSPFRR
jgi:hypothetical protein